jgi:hypothetical protein
MSPLLPGIIASGISGHLEPPYTPEGSAYELAKYTVPSGGVSEVTFAVPSDYRHIRLETSVRGNRTPVTYDGFNMRFNGDSGTNYSYHVMYGDGRSSAVNTEGGGSATSMPVANVPGSASLANSFGVAVIDVLDHASTTKNKTVRSLNGYDSNTTGWGGIYSSAAISTGAWYSTSAVSSITLIPQNSPFQQHSTFTLIGYK